MVNHELAQLALEARVKSVVVATTGSITLAAAAPGYTRSSGSFLVDGFAVGMEITPAGFAQNNPSVITAVTALTMTVEPTPAAQAAGAGRSLTAGLPLLRDWGNIGIGTPPTGRPYIEADYVPGPPQLLTIPAAGGTIETMGLYVVRWYGVANVGDLALQRAARALLDLFRPGYTLTLSDGTALRWREDFGPSPGQIRQAGPGWAVLPITIPWRIYSTNGGN